MHFFAASSKARHSVVAGKWVEKRQSTWPVWAQMFCKQVDRQVSQILSSSKRHPHLRKWQLLKTWHCTVLIMMLLYPALAACATCTIILVSASSCEQGSSSGDTAAKLWRTCSPFVTNSCLPTSTLTDIARIDRKWNNSVLLSAQCRKSAQFLGNLANADTFRHSPEPRFSRVAAFRLPG